MNDQENSQLEWEETGLPFPDRRGKKKRLCSAFSIPTPPGGPGVFRRCGFGLSSLCGHDGRRSGEGLLCEVSPFSPSLSWRTPGVWPRRWGRIGRVWRLTAVGPASGGGIRPTVCYVCKKIIFGRIAEAAQRDGFSLLLDGTNASDDDGDRPGVWALRELAVRSPLRECGLTKGRSAGSPSGRGCSPGTSRPMPAWPPGSPLGRL